MWRNSATRVSISDLEYLPPSSRAVRYSSTASCQNRYSDRAIVPTHQFPLPRSPSHGHHPRQPTGTREREAREGAPPDDMPKRNECKPGEGTQRFAAVRYLNLAFLLTLLLRLATTTRRRRRPRRWRVRGVGAAPASPHPLSALVHPYRSL